MAKCILWEKAKTKEGYGVRKIKGKLFYVHRLILAKKLNRPIRKGYCACHTCDNPACINPKHLFEATQKENLADMCRKGRLVNFNVGENNPHAKMTEKKVIKLRKMSGRTTKELSGIFGISQRTVQDILAYRLWKNI